MKGISIKLAVMTQSGVDELNQPIYEKDYVDVGNVLVGEPTTEDITDTLSLFGKRVAYIMAIPKGDTNDWVDTEVILPEPFAGTYRTIGYPTAGIEANIPLKWNKKVKVERI